jgi:hypothetical protein
MRQMRNGYKILAGKTEGKRPFGTPKTGLEDNITMDIRMIR